MKKVNLNVFIVDLKGEPLKDEKDGKQLMVNELAANHLVGSKGDSAIRKLAIAQAMYLNGDMELEDADYKLVKKVISESNASALIVAQILKAMGETE